MKNWKLVVLFNLLIFSGQAQVVTTIVDSSGVKFTDDIILDDEGNLFCADYSGSNVYKRTPDGEISTFISGLNTPNGLAFDSFGNLFVCDNIGSRIYKVDSEGVFLDTFFVNNPSGIIKQQDSDTMIFTEYGTDHVLSKLAPDGVVSTYHSGTPLNGPVGLSYDDSGQLFVANFTDRQVFKVYDDSLVYWATVPGPTFGYLGFLAFGGGYLWATSWQEQEVYGISTTTSDSTFWYAGSTVGSEDGTLDIAKFNSPNGIYSNPTGDTIYVSEYNSGKLRMISPGVVNVMTESVPPFYQLYPNPSEGKVTFQIENPEEVQEIVISNSLGSIISHYAIESNKTVLNFPHSGIFYLKIQKKNDEWEVRKVIINQ